MQSCYLLDVAAVDTYAVAGLGMLLLFLLACVLVEAVVIQIFNKPTFKKSFFTSLGVNLITTAVGFIIVPASQNMDLFDGVSDYGRLGVLFALTVVLELLLLKYFLRPVSWGKAAITSLVMNLVTYAILSLLLSESL